MMLLDSNDPFVAQAAPILATGRKWTPLVATEQAKAALCLFTARAVNGMGRSGEEEDLLERAVGHSE